MKHYRSRFAGRADLLAYIADLRAPWQPPPDGWLAFRAAQVAALADGAALDWDGRRYTLWRPGWRYAYGATLAAVGYAPQMELWQEAA